MTTVAVGVAMMTTGANIVKENVVNNCEQSIDINICHSESLS